MTTISGLGGANRSWPGAESSPSRQAEHEASMFAKVDSDGNGSLSSDELSQGLRDLMPPAWSTLDFAQSRSAANRWSGWPAS